jgi:acetylornithine aminotransferase
MKLTVFVSLVAVSSAFSPFVSHGGRVSSILRATLEKGTITAPSSINDDDSKAIYDEYVQSTYGRYPLTIHHGKGCKLYTTDGKEYLDMVSGIATCALGHANDKLTQAVVDQMNQMHHVSNLYYIPSQAKLAKWLCDNSVADKVFFCNSGAEANEAAIKCARRHASNRGITEPVIITAINSFHGRTLAALSATAQPKYHKGFGYGGKMVPGFEYVPYNDVEALKAKVKEINSSKASDGGKRGVAAIMMEALQGEGGIVPGTKEFFQTARQLCDDCGALLICDEVQVGMGRSGMLWGYENLDVEPDVFTSAKALGGGVPIGAMMARGEAATTFGPGDHASTYGGNPLACSAGLAVAQVLAEDNVLQNVRARGEQLTEGLEAIAAKYPTILGEVRGWGLLKGVQVQADAGCTAGELVGDVMEEGLLLVPAGPSVVRFVPPLIVSEQEISDALKMFEEAVAKRASS